MPAPRSTPDGRREMGIRRATPLSASEPSKEALMRHRAIVPKLVATEDQQTVSHGGQVTQMRPGHMVAR